MRGEAGQESWGDVVRAFPLCSQGQTGIPLSTNVEYCAMLSTMMGTLLSTVLSTMVGTMLSSMPSTRMGTILSTVMGSRIQDENKHDPVLAGCGGVCRQEHRRL